ncbi:polysaccharide biosynthesis/export family protein [Paracoccus ravus]|uniref:polysaccharide biosynthesis/export family protein n=1 Tax=Paracoccus ravus TaxID=2447760 RepID=UPI0014308C6E|nr:polysaccharide biosynthesis/export family protein [Paracoccus ravus]
MLVLAFCAGAVEAQEPGLMPGDLVDLRIYGRDDLSGQRRIDQGGRLLVPLLGRVEAQGLAPEALEARISEGLDDEGFVQGASVAIDLLRRPDVFVDGDVAAPGAYEWRPGLTVRHAITLAGGMAGARPDELSTTLEAYRAQETHGELLTRIDILRAREARHLAEIEFAQKLVVARDVLPETAGPIRFPEDILALPALVALRQAEADVLDHQSALHLASIRSMRLQREALTRTHELLKRRMDVNQSTVDLLRGRLEELLTLSRSGLIRTQEVVEMQTALSSAESSQLELLTSLATNEQETQRQDLSIQSVGMESRRAAAEALESVRTDLALARAELPAVARAFSVARAYLAQPGELHETEKSGLAIRRIPPGQASGPEAGLDDALGPGDMVVVSRAELPGSDRRRAGGWRAD